MAFGQYILDEDGNPRPEPDLLKWAMWLEYSHLSKGKDNRIVQQDWIETSVGKVHVSTVFLGLDHNNGGYYGPDPILWETMIFHGEHDQYMNRYSSKDAAIVGHMAAVEMVKQSDADLRELERLIEISGGWEKKSDT